MKLLLKIAVVIVVAILLLSSVYVIFFTNEEKKDNNNGNNGGEDDTEPPKIDLITGDATGKKGGSITISVTFSDNIGVTIARLYYKTISATEWTNKSILSGSFKINLNTNETLHYYVTVNDAAGNGPVGDPSTDGSTYYTITVLDDDNGDGYTRKVFVEESTSTTCKNCPIVADVLHELYDPDNPDFYYVSLVWDENSKAENRVTKDYNRLGDPTVFIDGGYEVIMGTKDFKPTFEQKLLNAAARDAPEIHIKVNAEWNESRTELTTTVNIENKESESYTGRLRVYITEEQSRWISVVSGEPFEFAFIDYAINEDATIQSNEKKTISKIWDASKTPYSDVDPVNLWIIAAIFSSDSTEKFSDPPPGKNKHPFDAYYTDGVDATRVEEGTLPPTVGITAPRKGYRYLFGRERKQYLIKNTIILGRVKIKASVQAEAGLEKLEFYIDGELKYNITEEPYEWSVNKIGRFINFLRKKHTIEVKAYDTQGRIATDSIDVITYLM
ncbi:MAG: hypothetical protein JSW60_01130 [Thermoplasmatales archaeon]|nr:MAG: hypothetical protein JSW60_01130 [Thermoplasmatales archaeon]